MHRTAIFEAALTKTIYYNVKCNHFDFAHPYASTGFSAQSGREMVITVQFPSPRPSDGRPYYRVVSYGHSLFIDVNGVSVYTINLHIRMAEIPFEFFSTTVRRQYNTIGEHQHSRKNQHGIYVSMCV